MVTALAVIAAIVWGSTFVVIKDTVAASSVYMIVFGRTFLSAVLMFLYLLTHADRWPAIFDKHAIRNGGILGALMAGTFLSQTTGLQYTSSGHSAFITGVGVVLVPLILFLFFKETLHKWDGVSILLVLLGLLFLTYDFGAPVNKGDAITSITAFTLAFHLVFAGKCVQRTRHVFSLIAYQFLFASVIALGGLLITGQPLRIPDRDALLAIGYLGIFGTLFCYFIAVWAQQYISSIKIALIFSLEPVFAAFFGYLLLQERLSAKELTGALLIVLGITLYQIMKEKRERSTALQPV